MNGFALSEVKTKFHHIQQCDGCTTLAVLFLPLDLELDSFRIQNWLTLLASRGMKQAFCEPLKAQVNWMINSYYQLQLKHMQLQETFLGGMTEVCAVCMNISLEFCKITQKCGL